MNNDIRKEKIESILKRLESIREIKNSIIEDLFEINEHHTWKNSLMIDAAGNIGQSINNAEHYLGWICEDHSISFTKTKQRVQKNKEIPLKEEIIKNITDYINLFIEKDPNSKIIFDSLEKGYIITESNVDVFNGYVYNIYNHGRNIHKNVFIDHSGILHYIFMLLRDREFVDNYPINDDYRPDYGYALISKMEEKKKGK